MSKPVIMVVDDDKGVSSELARIISATDKYEVVIANSAKEALEQLSKNKVMMGVGGNKIKLIILDIKMPEMDGLQFLEKIRKDYGEDIGVTMLTAYEDSEMWDRATSGFVVSYLKKPFKNQEVLETIDNYFAGRGADMTLNTFEKHIEKRDELEKKDKN